MPPKCHFVILQILVKIACDHVNRCLMVLYGAVECINFFVSYLRLKQFAELYHNAGVRMTQLIGSVQNALLGKQNSATCRMCGMPTCCGVVK